MRLKSHYFVLAALGLGAILSGCGGSSANTLPDPMVRFVNLSPDTTLDLRVDDTTKFTGETFAANTSAFTDVEEGEVLDFEIVETGSSVSLDAVAASLARDTDTLFIGVGSKNAGTETEKRNRLLSVLINRRVPSGSKARVIAMNAMVPATGDTSFPVIFKNPGTTSLISTGAIPYGESQALDIDAGPTDLVAQRESTDTNVAAVNKNFEAGKVYLMVLSGTAGTMGATAPAIRFIDIQTRL